MKPSTNPLVCSGTPMAPRVLLSLKILAVLVVLSTADRIPSIYLPLFRPLDVLPDRDVLRLPIMVALVAGAAAVLFNRYVRLGAVTMGLALMVAVLSARSFYSNNVVFSACFLLVAGLAAGSRRAQTYLSLQGALLYAGASINKLLDADWRSGVFLQEWLAFKARSDLGNVFTQVAVDVMAAVPPVRVLSSWAAMAGEAFLAAALLLPRWRHAAVVVGAAFHSSLIIVNGQTFGTFYASMLLYFLALSPWPERLDVYFDASCPRCARLERLYARLGVGGRARWQDVALSPARSPLARLHVVADGVVHDGFAAVKLLVQSTPLTYVLTAAVMLLALRYGAPAQPLSAPVGLAVILIVIIASPPFERVGEPLHRFLSRRLHQGSPRDQVA